MITYKAVINLDAEFSNITRLFYVILSNINIYLIRLKNEFNLFLWNFYLDSLNLIGNFDEKTQIYESHFKLFYKKFDITFTDTYLKYF